MINELISKLENNLKEAIKNNTLLDNKPIIKREFQKNRIANIGSTILSDIKLLNKRLAELENEQARALAAQLTKHFDTDNKEEMLRALAEIRKTSLAKENMPKDELDLNLPELPADIKDEAEADIKEMRRCYAAECYRSAVVLCGRLIETALHRKYYDATGNDILEKSPGIGLGNLIAKLNEKGIQLDPGVAQQVHLINQVRIFSVHKKQRAFYPSKAQANAIILFTLDTLEKLF